MKYVCKCGKFYKILKNGVPVLERFPSPDGSWHPYKLYLGDTYECACGARVTVTAHQPFIEHYMPEFALALERAKASNHLIDSEDC